MDKQKLNLKIKQFLLALASMLMFIFMMISVNANVGEFNKNSCFSILAPLNTSNVTLLSYTAPAPNSTTIFINKPFTLINGSFSYNFCDTRQEGRYIYTFSDNQGLQYSNDFSIRQQGSGLLYINFNDWVNVAFLVVAFIVAIVFLFTPLSLVGCTILAIEGSVFLFNSQWLVGVLLLLLAVFFALSDKEGK